MEGDFTSLCTLPPMMPALLIPGILARSLSISLVLTARSNRGFGGGVRSDDRLLFASISFCCGGVGLDVLRVILVYGDIPARGVEAGAAARGVAAGESQGVVSMLGVTWVSTNIKLSSSV